MALTAEERTFVETRLDDRMPSTENLHLYHTHMTRTATYRYFFDDHGLLITNENGFTFWRHLPIDETNPKTYMLIEGIDSAGPSINDIENKLVMGISCDECP